VRNPKWLVVTALGWLAAAARSAPAPVIESARQSLRISPPQIEIGLVYRVPPVRIEGEVAAGSEIVVVVRGENKTETFNKKVRAGPIWISSGKVHISGAPSLFLSFSSAPMDSLSERRTLDEQGLTPAGIRRHIHVDAGGEVVDQEALRTSYLNLKTRAGFYQVHNGGVELGRGAGPVVPFSVRFEWPRKAPPGTYTVTAFEWKNGAITPVAEQTMAVVETGFAALIADFATEKPAQYGVVCILLAVIAGFGIDFLATKIFRTGRRVAH
jgi:uncharacterized protein (TIGR02186 family)